MDIKKKSKKKAVSRKQPSRKKSQKTIIFNELKKILVGIIILVSACLMVAMIADFFLQPEHIEKKREVITKPSDKLKIKPVQKDSKIKAKKGVSGLKEKSDNLMKYEVFEDVHSIVKKPPLPGKGHVPQIAIIIDDIGYDKKIALALCDVNPNITFSILPFSPFGKVISEELHAKGLELMLHLPMEPVEYPNINPGPGVLLSTMSPDILIDQLKNNIRDIPYIVGVNNHMGSKLTSHSDQMNQIFSILKKENFFFVDSMTAPKSQCKASARLLNLYFAQRDIFLDNSQNTEYITGQVKKLIHLAKRNGSAIGIGHPYKVTLQVLSKELPQLENKVEIVRVSALIAIPE